MVQRSIGSGDPEYFSELLMKTSRIADRRAQHEQHCPDIPGIHEVDYLLSQRLRSILDVIANISICSESNVSATMADLREDNGSLKTKIYIIFNRQTADEAARCQRYLKSVFDLLRRVPYRPPADVSPKVLDADSLNESMVDLVDICRVLHNYSFESFYRRATKHEESFKRIQDRTYSQWDEFTSEQRGKLRKFFNHIQAVLVMAHDAQATKEVSAAQIQMLQSMYSYWTKENIMPSEGEEVALVDTVDKLLGAGSA